MPIGFIAFLETMAGKAKPVYRVLRWAFGLTALIFFGLDLANIITWMATTRIFQTLLLVTIMMGLNTVIRACISGHKNAQAYLVGFISLSLCGILEIISFIDVNFLIGRDMTAWGMLFLILSLVYTVFRDYNQMTQQLVVYAKEIETQNSHLEKAWNEIKASRDEIATWNKTLEQKVAIRTQELEAANTELSTTMSELKRAQTQLVQSEKMAAMGTLVAGLLHEMNTPLGAMRSNLQLEEMLLSSPDRDREEAAVNLLSIHSTTLQALDRISGIIKSLKNFSRIDEADKKEVQLEECLNATLELMASRISEDITIERHYHPIPPVICYPGLLNQAFFNILDNALDAMEGKGTLSLSLAHTGDMISIVIKDSGKGIPKENLSRIFDPGFTTKGVGIGTGLGLAIAYNIIGQHQGKIECSSAVGIGTSVHIMIPVHGA